MYSVLNWERMRERETAEKKGLFVFFFLRWILSFLTSIQNSKWISVHFRPFPAHPFFAPHFLHPKVRLIHLSFLFTVHSQCSFAFEINKNIRKIVENASKQSHNPMEIPSSKTPIRINKNETTTEIGSRLKDRFQFEPFS